MGLGGPIAPRRKGDGQDDEEIGARWKNLCFHSAARRGEFVPPTWHPPFVVLHMWLRLAKQWSDERRAKYDPSVVHSLTPVRLVMVAIGMRSSMMGGHAIVGRSFLTQVGCWAACTPVRASSLPWVRLLPTPSSVSVSWFLPDSPATREEGSQHNHPHTGTKVMIKSTAAD